MTRDDGHPIAAVFRNVCREQLGRVPAVEFYYDDDTDSDTMDCRIVIVSGVGRIKLGPFTIEGQGGMTDSGWYASLRREFRGWFRDMGKRFHS